MADAPRVFLSYAWADHEFAQKGRDAVAHRGGTALEVPPKVTPGVEIESAVLDT